MFQSQYISTNLIPNLHKLCYSFIKFNHKVLCEFTNFYVHFVSLSNLRLICLVYHVVIARPYLTLFLGNHYAWLTIVIWCHIFSISLITNYIVLCLVIVLPCLYIMTLLSSPTYLCSFLTWFINIPFQWWQYNFI